MKIKMSIYHLCLSNNELLEKFQNNGGNDLWMVTPLRMWSKVSEFDSRLFAGLQGQELLHFQSGDKWQRQEGAPVYQRQHFQWLFARFCWILSLMQNFSSNNSNILGHILIGVCKLWKVHLLVFDHQTIINTNLQITKIKWVILTQEVIIETTPDPVSPVIEKFSVTLTIGRPRVNSTFIRTLRIIQSSESSWDLKPLAWILTGELRSWETATRPDTLRVLSGGHDRVSVLRSFSEDTPVVREAPGPSGRVWRWLCPRCPGVTPLTASRGHEDGSAQARPAGQAGARPSPTPTWCTTHHRWAHPQYAINGFR